MTSSFCLHFILFCSFAFTYCFVLINSEDVAKLPFCSDDIKYTELIFVSTLDGIVTALDPYGTLLWQIKTGPGPLLSSSIHHLELTNNGQWIRLIPSLSGGLYKFDGITIDAIPISADSLLRSSFRYSDDLVVAGGKEVRTYGVLISTGQNLYECSWDGCSNTTDDTDDLQDVIIIERKSHTVRAVEPRTGYERWNFSVGQHNIKIPYIHCINNNLKSVNLNLTAVVPEGLLIAQQTKKHAETLWQHKFDAPIVAIWKWNGKELTSLNLFNSGMTNAVTPSNEHSIYVGMHNSQLYVHESSTMQHFLQIQQEQNDKVPVADSKSLTSIPWKPVPAANLLANSSNEFEDSTALSVLHASEYVNGNGYYLHTVNEEKPVCESNITNAAPTDVPHFRITLLDWWKEAVLILIGFAVVLNFLRGYTVLPLVNHRASIQKPSILPTKYSNSSISYSESTEVPFTSRYIAEFEPICCLGKGGYGVVFEAKKKFDECSYAIKRITLPKRPEAKDRMMREVKALAKLDHRNIVRYYNAWLECPPADWQSKQDQEWLRDFSLFTETSTNSKKRFDSSALTINLDEFSDQHSFINNISKNSYNKTDESLSVVFQDSKPKTSSIIDHSSVDCSYCPSTSKFSNQYYHTNHPPEYLYIQMQLCYKKSLKDWLSTSKDRDPLLVLDYFQQIVEAVEYVHFRGLIHRDLKPSNIFFSLEGQIKVGDFGLVTSIKDYSDSTDVLSPSILQQNYTNAVGTHLYMSPEQLANQQYDYKVDIYSLGIILFELLVSFNTEMERTTVLENLRKAVYPNDFSSKFIKEYALLKSMLSENPNDRPTATGVCERLTEIDGTHVTDDVGKYKVLGIDR